IETPARFQDFLPSPMQLFSGRGRDRLFAQQAGIIVWIVRPVTCLDPCYGLESKIAKALAVHCCTCTGKGVFALLPKLPRHRPYARLTLAVRSRLHHTFEENLKFSRGAKFDGDPLDRKSVV